MITASLLILLLVGPQFDSSLKLPTCCTGSIQCAMLFHPSLPVPYPHLQYDGDLKLPTRFLVPPPAISGTSGACT